jgi:hypothetical protein
LIPACEFIVEPRWKGDGLTFLSSASIRPSGFSDLAGKRRSLTGAAIVPKRKGSQREGFKKKHMDRKE